MTIFICEKYVGVYWNKKHKNWKALIGYNFRTIHIGTFYNELEAACAVNQKCRDLGIPIKNPQIENVTRIVFSFSVLLLNALRIIVIRKI